MISFWGLSLNRTKCKVTTFTSIHSPYTFLYLFLGSDIFEDILLYYGLIIDLGLKFSCNLGSNIKKICSKSLKLLSIVKRLAKDFISNKFSLNILIYCSIVRPILEHDALIWDMQATNQAILASLKGLT